ncbi:polysaccharide deacetylase family protein [Salipiger abyssi]|uniref:polysaccharide deacetylase family protein n=1 Tax=Salipiger abyssi TaxID=1250539 RepID=UPI001A8EEC78|nr:polysaccharide deacetylase family protein [Salipiger abyssi]MBN9888957.1 polysaccharide deacetylase family protein [Salipiger abyssi]
MTVAFHDTGFPACPAFLGVTLEVTARDGKAAIEQGFLGRHSHGRYALREGLWNLLEVFRAEDVKATFFTDPDDALRYPEMPEAIVEAGHELALLAPAGLCDPRHPERLARLEEQLDRLREVTGAPVTGWRAADGRLSDALMQRLPRLGFTYDSSFYDDDRPYVFDAGGGAVLAELPVFEFLTDTVLHGAKHPLALVERIWGEELNALHEAGGYLPLSLSCRADFGSGRMSRARAVGAWVAKARRKPGVGFRTAAEIAAAAVETCVPEPIPAIVD